MSKSKVVRMGLMGSAAALALVGIATTASAVEAQFGSVSIVFDTTVSMGGTMRTADRETVFLSEGNGGPIDPRSGVGDANVIPGAASAAFLFDITPHAAVAGPGTGQLRWTGNLYNYDGGVNGDDGRLNFDAGDLIGGNVKATHDLQISWRNYKLFARAVGFYDVVLNDVDAGARSQLTDGALGDVGRNYELLDFFVSADYTIGGLPLNVRAGKQVINWGESTFILGGNNVFNPIDVAAFRRPGAEIREGLVPVNAISASISLPFDVALSGYYSLDWESFELDPAGTPFSGSDIANLGSGLGGNENGVSFLSGSPFSGARRNCNPAVDGNTALAVVYGFGLLPDPTIGAVGRIDCLDNPFVDNDVAYTVGQHEATKLGLIKTQLSEGYTNRAQGLVSRDRDQFASDHGTFGVSMKWFAEALNGTEFGFYYQNYHSRLPLVSENAYTMEVGVAVSGHSTNLSSTSSKFAGPLGCLAALGPGGFADPRLGFTDSPNIVGPDFMGPGLLAAVGIADPQDLLNVTSLDGPTGAFALTGANGGLRPAGSTDTIYNAAVLNCALMIFQTGGSLIVPAAFGNIGLFDGSETLALSSGIGVYLEYPEDIDVFGMSFNSTLAGWGIQGDITYRPRAPFQVDTDSLTIAAAMEQCAFASVGDLMATFEALGTVPGHTCFSGGTVGSAAGSKIDGVMYNEMFTAQVGTTATFTASDWWVDALGADLGILVTEAGMVYVPEVEDTWLDDSDPDGYGSASPTRIVNQYQNTGCQGSDLPLGGLLGLDRKSSKQCRPTNMSAGMVLLTTLQYNNAFNSGWVIAPQLVYSYDFVGTTPSPYGNYMEDRQSVGFSVTGTLNNNLRVGASYSAFFGGHVNNKAKDLDFASLTASYTF